MKRSRSGFLGMPTGRDGTGTLAGSRLPSTSATALEKWLLRRLLQTLGDPPLRVRLWDGEVLEPADGPAEAGVVLHDRGTLWRLFTNPYLHFGDDYSCGRITVEGALTRFLETVYRAQAPHGGVGWLNRLSGPWLRLLNNLTLAQARENIHHHYDLGNDFYRLWLDEGMAYTCAYFPDPAMSLEAAQRAKMDLVCRKLRLQPGETVVEAGCGWGGLARHMARQYGVTVKAYNISTEQITYARERARREGLDGQVEYIQEDYRNIEGRFDAFVSVGMLEHVGRSNYAALGGVIDRCLKESGRGLIHTIGQNRPRPVSDWTAKRIFPGGYPPTLGEIATLLEPYSFSLQDVENLRQHYALTLNHWLERFDQHAAEVEQQYGKPFVRAWRLYLAGSMTSFRTNTLQLFQVLFSRPQPGEGPWHRGHMLGREVE